MPKIKKLPSGNWRTRIYEGKDENGKQIFTSITRPTKDEVVIAVLEHKKSGVKRNSMTVRKAIEDYIKLSSPILSPTTTSAYQRILDYAFQNIMEMDVASLDDKIMQNAINMESKRLNERTQKQIAPKTVKNEWSLLSASLNQMCNKTFHIKLPKIQHENEELPQPRDIMQAVAGTKAELPTLIAMFCGLRLSEIRGLTCDSVHDNELWIDKVMVEANNVSVLKNTAKTDSSIRKVSVPAYVLQRIYDCEPYRNYKATGENSFLVPMTRNMIYHHFTRNTQKAGIKMSFHVLRHEFASLRTTILAIPVKVTQYEGGWSSSLVLDRHYSQSYAEERDKATKKVDDYLKVITK